jgi:pimeloyl-ACP methyl ester carboxylesterase
MPVMVDKIERQLDEHGIAKAHLVGSSLGGWLALELAARGRALSVVGVCPAGGWDGMTKDLRWTLNYFQRNEIMLRRARPLLRTVAARPRSRRLAMRDVIADPSSLTATEAMMMFEGAAECAIVQDAIRLSRAQQMFGELDHIDAPVRVLYGTRDRIVRWPTAYVRMRRMLPEAEFVALQGLGHLPMWEAPELVTRLIMEVSDPDMQAPAAEPVSAASVG